MSQKSQAQHISELCRELLDDIELSRVRAEQLLLKSSRLARLVGSEEIQKWIGFEMSGYRSDDPVAMRYMSKTGRWTDFEKKEGYWAPLAQQEATIEALKTQLAAMRLPDISGDYIVLATNNVIGAMNKTSNVIGRLSGVQSRVLALLHQFVSEVFYEREFSTLAETAFERYKSKVDTLIAASAGDVLTKIPAVVSRLAEGEEEGVSQALATCRRILETFADAIFPPTDATIELGGNTLKLDASKHQNRINAFISQKTESSSRRQRLRQNLSNLFDRVSSGVHQDVTTAEAFSLFLNTYLFLGEVLELGQTEAEA